MLSRPNAFTGCADPLHATSTDGYCPLCKWPNGKGPARNQPMPVPARHTNVGVGDWTASNRESIPDAYKCEECSGIFVGPTPIHVTGVPGLAGDFCSANCFSQRCGRVTRTAPEADRV